MSAYVFSVRTYDTRGDLLEIRNYSHPVMVNTVISDARHFVSRDTDYADTIAHVEIWYSGTLIDTLIPEWLFIPEDDSDYEESDGPTPADEEGWSEREDYAYGYTL